VVVIAGWLAINVENERVVDNGNTTGAVYLDAVNVDSASCVKLEFSRKLRVINRPSKRN
jgi:hypothetical protein